MHGPSLAARVGPAVAGQVCLHATMAGARITAPLLALNLGHGKAEVGVLMACFALAQVFLSLPAGRYADRNGMKRLLRWCFLAALAGVCAAALWPLYPVLCAAALMCGGAVGTATIAMQRHVGRVAQSPSELSRAFSLMSLAPALANIVGPLLAGFVIDLAGFRAAFATLAALPVLAWLFMRGVCEPGGPAASGTAQVGSTWDLLGVPHMRRLMFVNLLFTTSWDFHGYMLPVYAHGHGVSASAIGVVMACFAVGVVAVRLATPMLVRRVQDWQLVTAAAALAGLLLLAYPFTRSAPAMAALSGLLGLALGCAQPMALTLLHRIAPAHRRGEALALRLTLSNSSGVLMPILVGLAGGVIGAAGAFWLLGAVVCVCSRAGVGLRRVGGAQA